ncbi:MAG: hypothetical protein ACYC61_04420 [Isosphaeraceae bacterium]
MLMAGSGISLEPIQPPPAQVAASPPVVPVPFHLPGASGPVAAVILPPGDQSKDGVLQPGSEIELDRISVGNATGDLWLELTWSALPRGAAGELSVFDETGRLLADSSTAAGSNCCVVELSGPTTSPDSVLYVEARIIEPAAAGGAPLPGTSYHLQIESQPPGTASAGSDPDTTTADSIMMGTTGRASRASASLQHPLPYLSAGATSSGPGPSIGTPGGDLVPDVSPSGISTAGGAVPGDGETAPTMEASPAVNTPVAVNPLPASSYEPAGGIFEVDEAAERDDRGDETRVEMSLVRIVSPGREGSLEDRWSSDRDPSTQPDATDAGSSDDVALWGWSLAQDWSMEPGGEISLLVAAILLPIDERDRPATLGTKIRRGDAADGEPWDGLGGAIALSVSSSAVLGSALYAPDVTAAMHRARPHSRARAARRREEGR